MTPPFPLFVLLTCRKQLAILLQLFQFNEPNSFNQGNVYKVNDCILIESIKRFSTNYSFIRTTFSKYAFLNLCLVRISLLIDRTLF